MRVFTTSATVRQLTYTADGTRLAACVGDRFGPDLLDWWDLSSGKMVGTVGLRGMPAAVAFAVARPVALLAYPHGDNIEYLAETDRDTTELAIGRLVTAVGLTADGTRIAFSCRADAPVERSTITVATFHRLENATVFQTGTRVRNLIFNSKGDYLVSVGTGQYTVWDIQRRESRTAGTLSDARPVAFSPDGTRLAVAGNNGATLFDADGRRSALAVERPGSSPVAALAFSPAGRSLFLVAGPSIHVYDVPSGALRQSYDWNLGPLYCVAVAPDGLTAAAGTNRCIVIWDLDG